MTREELLQRIWIDPQRCFGKPCIRGHRIWVSLILDLLATGMPVAEILAEYPGLTEADIQACIAYGAEMSRERYVSVPLEPGGVKLKLDENLGLRGQAILAGAGHDVCTVAQQSLTGHADSDLIERCRTEDRCLVTLDLDFANPFVFLPSQYPGIAVLRLPPRPSRAALLALVQTLANALEHDPIKGKLWIVESARIRIYQEKPTD